MHNQTPRGISMTTATTATVRFGRAPPGTNSPVESWCAFSKAAANRIIPAIAIMIRLTNLEARGRIKKGMKDLRCE